MSRRCVKPVVLNERGYYYNYRYKYGNELVER